MFEMTDSYWKFRRARLAVKRPEFALLDLLLFAGGRNKGERLGYLDQCKGMYANGQYHAEKGMEMMTKLMRRVFKRKPESVIDKSMRLKDKDWEDIDRSEAAADDGKNRSEAFGNNERSEKSTDIGQPRRTEDDVRVWVTPEDTRNRLGTNQVGPERQVRKNEGPWPLARPEEDKTLDANHKPFAIEDKRDDQDDTKGERKDGKTKPAGKSTADKAETSKDGKTGSDTKSGNVSSIEDARKKKSATKTSQESDADKAKKEAKERAKRRRKSGDDLEL